MIKDENYIVINGWMINHSDMNLMELVLYAVIQGFSQDGNSKFTGALSYLCDVTGKSKNTVSAALNGLLGKHLIVKEERWENNLKFCHYYTVYSRTGRMTSEEGSSKIDMGVVKNCTSPSSEFDTHQVKICDGGISNSGKHITNYNNNIKPAGKPEAAAADPISNKIIQLFGASLYDSDFIAEVKDFLDSEKIAEDKQCDYIQFVFEKCIEKRANHIPSMFRTLVKAADVMADFKIKNPDTVKKPVIKYTCPVCGCSENTNPYSECKNPECGFDLNARGNASEVTHYKQVYALGPVKRMEYRERMQSVFEGNFSLNPAEIKRRNEKIAEINREFGISA